MVSWEMYIQVERGRPYGLNVSKVHREMPRELLATPIEC